MSLKKRWLTSSQYRCSVICVIPGVCLEAIGEAKVEWMTSSDIQASDEEVFNYTTVLPIKGMCIKKKYAL